MNTWKCDALFQDGISSQCKRPCRLARRVCSATNDKRGSAELLLVRANYGADAMVGYAVFTAQE